MTMERAARAVAVVLATATISCSRDITPDVAAAVRQAVEAPDGTADDAVRTDVRNFYRQRGYAPVWLQRGDQAPVTAERALAAVRRATEHGFSPADYDEPALARAIEAEEPLVEAEKDDHDALAHFDVRVTAALLALGRDVAVGRTKPGAVDKGWTARRTPPDLVGTLEAALTEGLDGWLDAVRPRHPEYAALQKALAAIRADGASDTDPRAATIALNLQRWRWMPDDFGARHLLVNVPAFYMAAREDGMPVLQMKVIVGTPENATPIFSGDVATVVFSPYWNVPESIAAGETVPAAAKDPTFLTRNQMEVLRVSREGTTIVDPKSIRWDDPAALEGLSFRQKPGAHNSLGHVKFLFLNKYDVYLHDTPADSLFSRAGRALSHGCVRLEQPEELAKYVLRDRPEWNEPRIRTAMHAGEEQSVALRETIPVHIVYFTAWPKPDGSVEVYPDIYGFDARQARAAHEGPAETR